MIRNFLLIAWRQLKRNPGPGSVNILGLTAAFFSVIAILLAVRQEWNVDRYHKAGERIYRLVVDETKGRPDGRQLATTAPPMGPALVREYPEVEQSLRLRYSDEAILSYKNEQYYEHDLIYADSTFFDFFSLSLQQGDPETALAKPDAVVLTPAMAKKYFGEENPLGKTLTFNQDRQLTVTGVLAEEPRQTHLDLDFLVSFATFRVPPGYPVTLESWSWISFPTYILLGENADKEAFEVKLHDFVADHYNAERAEKMALRLQPLPDIYFHSGHLMNTRENRKGNLSYTRGLLAIALLILLIAGFNFLNLSTARSLRRAREVGVRKVLGATAGQVRRQFLGEAFLLSSISLLLGILLLLAFRQPIAGVLGQELQLAWSDAAWILPGFLLLSALVALGAGFYPALVLSRHKAALVLKGHFQNSQSGSRLRTLLVGGQFFITAGLIIASLAVWRQMEYIRQRDMGFDREQVVALQLYTPDFQERFERARQIFAANPHVSRVTAGDVFDNDYGSVPVREIAEASEEARPMHIFGIHFDYFETLGIEVVEGRGFNRNFPQDTARGIVLNETAVRAFGWEEPVGKRLQISDILTGEVVGVTEDFHFSSLHEPVKPLVMFPPRTIMSNIILRLQPGDMSETIASLEKDWEAIAPDMPFQLSFVDEQVGQLYAADRRFSGLILFFTLLSIIIAFTGLYSLIRVIVGYRMREVGIRKVLGASLFDLALLLGGRFLWLALLAGLLAWPLSWWLSQRWLQQFAYRVELPVWLFLLAIAGGVLLAALSVGREALWAASRKPVDVLKVD